MHSRTWGIPFIYKYWRWRTTQVQTAKAPGACTNRLPWPQHTASVWFMEGAAVHKLPNPWLLCSKLQAKGKQRLARGPGATEPMLFSRWAAQLGKFGSKGQSAGTGPGLTVPGDHIQNHIQNRKKSPWQQWASPPLFTLFSCSLIGSLWSQEDGNSTGSKRSICFWGWREKEGKLENVGFLLRN